MAERPMSPERLAQLIQTYQEASFAHPEAQDEAILSLLQGGRCG